MISGTQDLLCTVKRAILYANPFVYGGPHTKGFHNPLKTKESPFLLAFKGFGLILGGNSTRQGYARKRILKPAGHLFLGVGDAP